MPLPPVSHSSELAFLRVRQASGELKELSSQEEQFLLLFMNGMSVDAAEQAVGFPAGGGTEVLRDERVKGAVGALKDKRTADVEITRGFLTQLLLEAHSHSGTAMEEIAAVREIGKLHGLYESDKQRSTNITVNNNAAPTARQIQRASDQELIELAGETITLDPEDYDVTES